MFDFSLRWSVYSSLAFFTCLGIAVPMTRFFAIVLVVSYLIYMIWDTVKNAMEVEEATEDFKLYLLKSAIVNTPEYICFIVSITIGIFLGSIR